MVTGNVRPVNIEDEMRGSYLDYAMSVIVSRALPDVRDGLKPVHRRILYAMNDMGVRSTGPHRKSARIVGEVMGKYHPHGDAAIYDTMVRMAQDFSMRYPLVDGQGNFGSVDNDPAAAMRYTEARLAKIADEMLIDIDKDTVDFTSNFDDSLKEPWVLPARLPNLLLNGGAGIAVGMATNIPPHNLNEICDAISYLIENPEAGTEDLYQFVKGPDFPTAGIIQGREGIRNAYSTGRGKIVVRAKAHFTTSATGRRQIIVSELPYQTNKAGLLENIADLVRNKKLDGISDLRDESDRQGMRVVIEIKREADQQKVLNNLFKHTAMQSAFHVNMLALVDGQPKVISLKEALQAYINFRREVITRRTKFDLKQAKARAHILEGLRIALDNIDAVIRTIRESETAEAARRNLMSNFELSQIQAQAILDMQLRRLANLERQKIMEEYQEVLKQISYLEDLLANPRRILDLIREDMTDLKQKYGDDRRTEILEHGAQDFSEEDLIPHERVAITLSARGFVKRVPAETYTKQHRGGVGIKGQVIRGEEDAVMILTAADTHDDLFFFTDQGKVFFLKAHEIPASSRTAKGLAIINLLSLGEKERVTSMVATQGIMKGTYLIMTTRQGEVKKTAVELFATMRSNGLIAMDLEAGDELASVCLATDKDDVIIGTRMGQSITFAVKQLRAASRTSGGVRGIKLDAGDTVVGTDRMEKDGFVFVVSEGGYGKITPVEQYPRQKRGGQGVRTFKIVEKTGDVTAIRVVTLTEQVMLISADGMMTRTPIREADPKHGISIQGRSTQGVKVMDLREGDKLVAITTFAETNKQLPLTDRTANEDEEEAESEQGQEESE